MKTGVAQQLHFEKHLLGGSSQSLRLAFIIDPLSELKAAYARMGARDVKGKLVLVN